MTKCKKNMNDFNFKNDLKKIKDNNDKHFKM